MQDTSWPSFLDRLDTDRKTALLDFYRFLVWTLNKVPPRPMRHLCREDQEDVKQEIFLHCVAKDCRVLRQYINSGKPFAAWLYTVAHNVCIDYLRKKGLEQAVVSVREGSDHKELTNVLPDPSASINKRLELGDLLSIVKRIIAQMDEYCRMLLEMAADEFAPKEMVTVLRLPPDQNKKVSDDLRYCREKLKKKLAEADVDIASLIKA